MKKKKNLHGRSHPPRPPLFIESQIGRKNPPCEECMSKQSSNEEEKERERERK